MPSVKTKRISTLIESQLPEFITTEYELFSKFIQKYYEAQEVQGGTLDIINNLQKYADIDYYEKNLLRQFDTLVTSISDNDTTIVLEDATSFPEKNGYVKIDNEIIFYESRTGTTLQSAVRGVSGNTTLGDLYSSSEYTSTDAASHSSGTKVLNVSNLFLYSFVKNFESQYLGSFPEKYLKGEVDKRTLIKNIQKFYKAKGTTSSIEFIFNTIVAKDHTNKPEVYKPRDFTYKVSNADWVNVYAIKAKVITGDVKSLVGKKIVQEETTEYGYADATVDNVYADGTSDGEKIFNIVLAPETVNGDFSVSTKTRLETTLSGTASTGDRVNVFSTVGWDKTGSILIGEETISFSAKTATQFIIDDRVPQNAVVHNAEESVYKPVTLTGYGVTLLTLGVVYNALPKEGQPFSDVGDKIQTSNPGFETADTKIVNVGTNQTRWIKSTFGAVNVPTLPAVVNSLNQVPTDVSAIFADDQYYYIASSSFPSHKILDGTTVNEEVLDQKLLKIIRKEATRTTESYPIPKSDIGIGLNGVPFYGYKDPESIRFGLLEEIKVDLRGTGYVRPPFVLIDQVPNKARSILTGQVVESIIVDTQDIFPRTPDITITSGRGAVVSAVVTGGKVTSLTIDNPGEFYSSPPLINIRDNAGRGRFAEYESIVNTDGQITGFNKIGEGNFYNQNTVIVDVIPVGNGASGTPLLKEWNFNRYKKLENNLDTENGSIFANINNVLEYGYGYVANPKALRVSLNDNLNSAGTEPASKSHSPIIGFAYDGNPIYGAFGYEDPLDPSSSIIRMTSSYSINGTRSNGPSLTTYPIGSFVNDYTYTHKSGTLDQNNGRFCITPEFPKGTYAYFITIDSNQVPQYPYILGENYYSLPVDSNYNSNISQDDIPKKAKRLYEAGMPRNGEGFIATISDVKSGTVDAVNVNDTSDNFSINSQVYFDNKGTQGSEAEAIVSSVKGKNVNYLESKQNKVVKLTTIQSAYLFVDDTLSQPSSGAFGTIVGTVKNDSTIVLRNVSGTFDNTGAFSAAIKTFDVLLDQRSSYTKGATLSLTDGINAPIATAEVLEGTSSQNVVQIKVLTGIWNTDNTYFIQSDDLFNTSGTRIVRLTSLSDGLEPFEVNQSVALIETAENHGLGIDDKVTIDINPDDSTTTKIYYLRKRLYQEAILLAPSRKTNINFTGIGRYEILNGGADYTSNTYTGVSLTGGSGSGATATIAVSGAGVVSNVTLENAGTGYVRGDLLSVADEDLVRSGASQSTSRLTIYVGHSGLAAGGTSLIVDNANGFAEQDYVQIGDEILQITGVTDNTFTVTRGQQSTSDVDHFDGQEVSLYQGRYNFTPNFQIFSGATSGYIQSYDPTTQKIVIVYDYGTLLSNAQQVALSSSFFDTSTPQRLVAVRSAGSSVYKFEFSEDNNTFVPNPTIDLQEFYKYKFDTSHSSLTGTYFDISPSNNYNLITIEKIASTILPGNAGAFTDVKFGYGYRAGNTYQTKTGTDFTNFYYFDNKNIVNPDNAYFRITTDPLQSIRTVNYVTPNRFVYDIPSEPLWDGSGSISYTTTGQFAIGKINTVDIINLGINYKKVPIILGVDPNKSFKASATVLFDSASNIITGVNITNEGSNYSNPKVVITNGDGVDASFNIVGRQGKIFSITVENVGRGYTFAPEIEIIEGDVEAYVDSDSIGVPKSISITRNGGAYHLDKTVASTFTSNYILSVKPISGSLPTYRRGEIVVQKINGVEVARGKVTEWRDGSNLLKIENVTGILREDIPITSILRSEVTATVTHIFVTLFDEQISSFYDNLGFYQSDKGKLGVSNQKITDSFFYQDYSYVVKSKTSIEQWRDLIKSTTHPAGFKLFGQVDVEATASSEMPVEVPKASHFSVIQLWDPNKNRITVENSSYVITQSIQKVENQRIRKAFGTAATSEFNFNEVTAFEFTLNGSFDGYYDDDGRLQGTTSFQILRNGIAYTPSSSKGLIVTLDGVLQEPNVAYTISGDNIVFAHPPLGDGIKAGSTYKGVTFYGKVFQFKDDQYNTKHLRKIRNIFQRGGTWIDAANQIERNVQFIINETIGYGKAIYPSLDWNTKQDDYEDNIRALLDAFQHDLRFGGNVKTVDYTSIFNSGSEYLYIQNKKAESIAIFEYANRLAKLAIRNWDYIDNGVSYFAGGFKMTVTSTDNLAVGLFVSSGKSYPDGTKIVSIDSDTEITLNNAALANSAGGGGAPQGVTFLSGTGTTGPIPTSTGAVAPPNVFNAPPGVIVTIPTSFSGLSQAKFGWSALNNGMFYKAGELIDLNRDDIASKSLTWSETNYPSATWGSLPNKEDIGNLIDAYVYHLKLGGNFKLVERAQLYWRKNDYPYGEQSFYDSGRGRQDMWIKRGTSRGSSFESYIDDNYFYTGGMLDPTPGGGTNFNARELYVAKWNFDGTLVWAKQIDDTLTIQTNNIVVDKQGNVYACGSTNGPTTIGGPDVLIVKLDSNGNSVWQKTYGKLTEIDPQQGNEFAMEVLLDADENLIMSTRTGSFSTPTFGLMKIDPNGDIVWEKEVSNVVYPKIAEPDGSFYAISYDTLGQIVYLDKDGNIIWQKELSTGFSLNSIHKKSNGNFIINGNNFQNTVPSGKSQSYPVFIETDSNFNIINQKTFEETLIGYSSITYAKVDSKGNIYGTGLYYDSDIGVDSYAPIICKVNSDLNVEWIRKLDAGNINTELNYGIEISPNEKHIFTTGFTRNSSGGFQVHTHAKLLVDGSGLGTYGDITYSALNFTGIATTSYTISSRSIGITESTISHTVVNQSLPVLESGYVIETLLDSNASPSYSGTFDVAGTVATFEYAKNLMIAAMRNQGIVTDPNVLVDSASPACAEVESSLNTYHSIVDTILTEGRNLVEKTDQNQNKTGNWTNTRTYSNYNILGDPLLPEQECNTVISAMDSLHDNLSEIINENPVTKSLPDYVDGETTDFELYWDDNTEVDTEKDENLFLSLNAVLQRPKFTKNYPLSDAYFIDRTVIPNVIKFDVPPIWDQDLGAKTIGEPTAVEKVTGIGVGNYKRLTIDKDLVDGVRNGPFLILDVEDLTVQSIESEDNLYVFLDGVLQVNGKSYTVSGPNITFATSIKPEMNIDMRYLYGRDVGQILNIYDFAPDTYYATGTFSFDTDATTMTNLLGYTWMGDALGAPIHVWQVRANGTLNVIGALSNASSSGSTVTFEIRGQNGSVESGLDLVFAPKGYYDRTFTIADADISNEILNYNTDSDGRKLLKDDNAIWAGTNLGKTYKPPFVYLSNGDKIRVEGEEGFRKVKELPQTATSKDGRPSEQLSDDIFGAVSIETYTGTTRGEGLSVVATVENGSVVSLSWNQRSYDPITQPTAYQYFTPPVLKFIPNDSTGGGARAEVIVSKGQVLSVDLIDGGSGYTVAPKVVTTRRFDILTERDIGVSVINIGLQTSVQTGGMTATSFISEIDEAGVTGITGISSLPVQMSPDRDVDIIAEIQTGATGLPTSNIVDNGFDMPIGVEQPDPAKIVFIEPPPVVDINGEGGVLRLQGSASVVNAEVQDIVSLNSISTVSKVITATQQIEIPNNAISNVNYFENAAVLDVDFLIGDVIAYIADTSKFAGQGRLLIGDELIYYERKLSDRFYQIIRGYQGTTEQDWLAGTYLRQIEDVTVVSAGLVQIDSESDVSMVNASAGISALERVAQRQIVSGDFSVAQRETQVTIMPPPSGAIDQYQETVFLVDPVPVRAGNTTGGHDGEVDLIEINGGYHVARRLSTEVLIVNSVFGRDIQYQGNYIPTNVGHNVGHFDGIFEDGFSDVSGMTVGDVSRYFADLTIGDFTERGDSSYLLSGSKFNLAPPSIQNPVTVSGTASSPIPSTITVVNTNGFPTSGYIFHTNGTISGIIKYTGKTANSFTGCTLHNGSNQIASGSDIIPTTIV